MITPSIGVMRFSLNLVPKVPRLSRRLVHLDLLDVDVVGPAAGNFWPGPFLGYFILLI